MGLPLPFKRSYWAKEGKLLAGCYPGDEDANKAGDKLAGLVDAQIGTVINLMEPDESNWNGTPFHPYQDRVVTIGKMHDWEVSCLRFPIRDMHIPTIEQMENILDTIDLGLTNGKGVYVHCWGGKGRTGTVIGCWLIRHGRATPDNFVEIIKNCVGQTLNSDRHQRMKRKSNLYGISARLRKRGEIMDESRKDRFRGCLLGLAVGDALGTTLEFKRPGTFEPITDMIGGGPFGLKPGQWTDDTSIKVLNGFKPRSLVGSDPL